MDTIYYKSSIGTLKMKMDQNYLYSVELSDESEEKSQTLDYPLMGECLKQLDEYFMGQRQVFTLPIKLQGTPFQLKVWDQLLKIPYGNTFTYGEIAKKIGNPKAARAVGGANNKNKLMIIVPCHRVIGTNKKLVGYAGGVDKKEYLLRLEKTNGLTF